MKESKLVIVFRPSVASVCFARRYELPVVTSIDSAVGRGWGGIFLRFDTQYDRNGDVRGGQCCRYVMLAVMFSREGI